MRENGQLHMAVNTANETLSRKVYEIGLNVGEIMDEIKGMNRLEPDLLNAITSSDITERLSNQMDALDM